MEYITIGAFGPYGITFLLLPSFFVWWYQINAKHNYNLRKIDHVLSEQLKANELRHEMNTLSSVILVACLDVVIDVFNKHCHTVTREQKDICENIYSIYERCKHA